MINGKTKQLVTSAILSATIMVICIALSSLSVLSRNAISLLLSALIGYFYSDFSLKYSITSNIVIVTVMTAIYGIWLGLALYLPMSLLGVLFSFAFKWKTLKYYLVCLPLAIILNTIRIFIYSSIAGLNIFDYVAKALNENKYSSELFGNGFSHSFIVLFLACYIIAFSVAELFVAIRVNRICKKLFDAKLKNIRS